MSRTPDARPVTSVTIFTAPTVKSLALANHRGSEELSGNYLLQFLESTSNIRTTFAHMHGWRPNERIASDIAACLRQGRLFYQAAHEAPPEIQPLQMHYGMVAYAKALILWSRRTSLNTLKQRHGVADSSEDGQPLSAISVKVEREGTFAAFNDVVASRNRIKIYEGVKEAEVSLPTAPSESIAGMTFQLDDLLSRIPRLHKSAQRTFGKPAGSLATQISEYNGVWNLRIDTATKITDLDVLRTVVAEWRRSHPFLAHWHFNQSTPAYGSTAITFVATAYRSTELNDDEIQVFPYGIRNMALANLPFEDSRLESRLPPLAGGSGISSAAVLPINGVVLSEYSIQYLALHSLSSLVRYRPHIWMKALAGSRDDHMLALISEFLRINEQAVPHLVASELLPESTL